MSDRRLQFATAPTIVRANQKDAYYENVVLSKRLSEAARILKGSTFVHNHAESIQSAASLLYLGLTTLLGTKTLGEEYVDLFYVDREGKKLPRVLQRLGFVLLYVGGPRLLKRFKTKVNLADLLSLHTALFYFSGRYYQFSKRLFGLRYALGYKADPRSRQSQGNYELLGLLIIAQLLIKYSRKVHQTEPEKEVAKTKGDCVFGIQPEQAAHIDLEDPDALPYIPEASRTCMLCLSPMKDPSCASCGHIFCWTCILDWCHERPECPLCRASIRESEIMPLR